MAVASGDYSSPFRGQGLAFHEVREYRPHDDIRSIDWRVTARTGKPHVKIFTEERERTVILCVDANATMRFGTRGTFKSVQAARAAALLAWQANGSKDSVGCLIFGDVPDAIQFFAPSRSRQPLWQALKLLCEPWAGSHSDFIAVETALQYLERSVPTGALVLVVGDFHQVDHRLEKPIGTLRRRCDMVLIAINDPADQTLPQVGPMIFSDGCGSKVMLDTNDRANLQAYARQWRQNRETLEEIARRQAIEIVDLHTDKDVFCDLQAGLRRASIRKGRR